MIASAAWSASAWASSRSSSPNGGEVGSKRTSASRPIDSPRTRSGTSSKLWIPIVSNALTISGAAVAAQLRQVQPRDQQRLAGLEHVRAPALLGDVVRRGDVRAQALPQRGVGDCASRTAGGSPPAAASRPPPAGAPRSRP